MSTHLEHGNLLIQQERFEMAEQAYRQHLAEEPNDGLAHSQLAMSLLGQKRPDDALAAAREGVGLLPDFSYSHYVLGEILLELKKVKEAEEAAREAMSLDPEDPDLPALLAQIFQVRRNWKSVLEFAEQGLALDPEHIACNNFRAHALQMLNRHDEAGVTLESTLDHAPENPWTHANQGWNFLRQGDHQTAIQHFKESLRIDPGNEYARQGIIEALKARSVIYRPILAYFVWCSRLSEGGRWGVIIGAWLLFKFARGALGGNEALRPLLIAVIAGYMLFVLTAWAGQSIFNTTLWFHPLGRHALNRDEKRASILCSTCLFAGLAFLGCALTKIGSTACYYWAGLFPFLCIPIASAYNVEKPSKRRIGLAIFFIFAGLAIRGSVSDLLNQSIEPHGTFGMCAVGLAIFTWISAFILRD